VARYGGEEFAVIAAETDKAGALELAERLRCRIEETEFQDAGNLPAGRMTVSIGVASFPTDAQDKASLIERADQALYRSKESGRNCVVAWQDEG
jgi:diguanylate cyclase (GGDEF)-like protein